ncbi:MAG: fibrobacter succinogenes major paralogous domain-containing protein, partial [Bacteroidota bacterium]
MSTLKISLLSIILSWAGSLQAQLREFKVAPYPDAPSSNIVQASAVYPDNALILVYTDLPDLNFRSSMNGINQVTWNPTANRYQILAKPIKQLLFVFANKFIETSLGVISPQPKQVLSFKVEEKPVVEVDSKITSKPYAEQSIADSYPSVKIRTQIWMTENLNVERFSNGDLIPEARTDAEWAAAGIAGKPAWCHYENNPENGSLYGKLYNGYAVEDARKLCPAGWHVPSDAGWTLLTQALGGENVAGKKMKASYGWDKYGKGTNESGFSGLPGCFCTDTGAFSPV